MSSCLLRIAPSPDRGSPVRYCLENTFAVIADSFSPQGVRSVGRRLFENLLLQVFRLRRSRLASRHFRPPGWPSGLKMFTIEEFELLMSAVFAHGIQPLGSNFQTPQWLWGRRRCNRRFGFVFTKPSATARVGCSAARQSSYWVRIFKLPTAIWGLRRFESALRFVFTKPSATARLGSFRSPANHYWVRIFKLAQRSPGQGRSDRRLGLFLQASGVPQPKRRAGEPPTASNSFRLSAAASAPRPSCASSQKLGSFRRAANRPLGSYFQTRPAPPVLPEC